MVISSTLKLLLLIISLSFLIESVGYKSYITSKLLFSYLKSHSERSFERSNILTKKRNVNNISLRNLRKILIASITAYSLIFVPFLSSTSMANAAILISQPTVTKGV